MARSKRRSRGEIVEATLRKYSDTGQLQACVVWDDKSRTCGDPHNRHMKELLKRARREGTKIKREYW